MSNDREVRRRLEEVQSTLAELAPQRGLAESPGFAERLASLEEQARALRSPTKEVEERLAYFSADAEAVERDVETLHLAAQNKQTAKPPAALSAALGLVVIPGMFLAMLEVASAKPLTAMAAYAVSMGFAFGVGALLRARVVPPPKKR